MNISDGIKLFNDGDYFEAHDHFEEMWINSQGTEQNLYQALTQISVGFYHLISGNYEGAKSQLQKGIDKLKVNSEKIDEINIPQLLSDLTPFLNELNNPSFNEKANLLTKVIPLIKQIIV